VLKTSDQNNRNKLIAEQFGGNAEKAAGFLENLLECVAGRGDDAFVPFNDENMEKGILARNVHEMAVKEYSDWKDIAVSYLVGRGMFGGDSIMLNGLYSMDKKTRAFQAVSAVRCCALPCCPPQTPRTAGTSGEIGGGLLFGLFCPCPL
jgi:hypothetical protein